MSRGPGRRPWCIAPTRPCSASRRGGALCEVMGTPPRVAKIGGLKGSGEGVVSERPGAQRFSAGRCDRRLRSRPGLHRCGESMWLDSGRHDGGNPGHRHHGGGLASVRGRYARVPDPASVATTFVPASREFDCGGERGPEDLVGGIPRSVRPTAPPTRQAHSRLPPCDGYSSLLSVVWKGGVWRARSTGGRPRCGVGVGVRVRTRR